MAETVYTSGSQLNNPKLFFREAIEDLKATREIGWRLFLRNLRSQYRQSWLGYLWLIFPPLATALIWVFLTKAKILTINNTTVPYPVYVLTGMFLWQTFVETLNCPLQQLSSSKAMITKVKFPHEALILAGLGGVLFNLAIRIVALVVVLLWFKISFSITFLFAPLGIFSILIFALAIGLLLTPIGLLYNDVANSLSIFTTIWFFLTPIVYPMPKEGLLASILSFNPLTSLIITTRNWLTMRNEGFENGFILTTVLVILVLSIGWIIYRIARPHLIVRLSG